MSYQIEVEGYDPHAHEYIKLTVAVDLEAHGVSGWNIVEVAGHPVPEADTKKNAELFGITYDQVDAVANWEIRGER